MFLNSKGITTDGHYTNNFNSGRYNNYDTDKSISIYIKILINYSQMISIIHTLQMKWPFYVTDFFQFLSYFGFFSTNIISLDCLLSDLKINISGIYLKALSNVIFYIFFLSLGVMIFVIRQFIFKRKGQFSKFIMFFLVFSIMIQPNSIKDTSDIFTCQKVDQTYYLVNQMSIECYTDDHVAWVYLTNHL